MPTLNALWHVTTGFELARWIVQFIVWCFALWALATALWRSFPAREFYSWLWRDSAKSARIDRLRWEIGNGLHWSEEVGRGRVLVQGQPLSPQELDARRREFEALAKVSFGKRAVTYFLQCPLCQHFWTAMALAFVADWSSVGDLAMTALSYSTVVTILFARFTSSTGAPKNSSGCRTGNCGGH